MNIYIILVLVFITSFTGIFSVWSVLHRDRKLIEARLLRIVTGKETKEKGVVPELNKSFLERAVYPLVKLISKNFARFMPESRVAHLEKQLLFAGNPGNLAPHEFLGIQYTLTFGAPLLAIVILLSLGLWKSNQLLLIMGIGALGYFLPSFYLKVLSDKRKIEIEKSLPDTLDLLTVSVEAGLGFDSALAKVSNKTKGPLAYEFIRVLQEIKMGKPRRDALKDLTLRCDSASLSNFISSLIQADQLGVSIGNVLRLQSEQMRQKKRQLTEEKAMKAPVKMLIPLVLFVFPTLFIVLLGPAVIQIFQTLVK